MDTKLFEIRDRATCIPAMATRISGEDGPIVRRAGFRDQFYVLLTSLPYCETRWDPITWPSSRTMKVAHAYIEKEWPTLTSGQVIDVRVILHETNTPAKPDCV